ncbi:hypothetical protein OV450_3404 [Actinobacteria bacterium OV450]|nr:hypothetical protein OV450_3404 [Actinobacteria bacterium OV450]
MSRSKIKIWKHDGLWYWNCTQCPYSPTPSFSWSLAMQWAQYHHRLWHRETDHAAAIPHDMPTPPNGVHYDWSSTGTHLKVVE